MAEEDEGGWEDRLLMVGHNKVVALVFPHQIRNRLHLHVHIAGKQRTEIKIEGDEDGENVANEQPHYFGNIAEFSTEMLHTYLKKAMRRLTISIYCTKR